MSSDPSSRPQLHRRGQRILVVDDEPAVRAALERALQVVGYDVALAEDGRVALDRIAGTAYDAIVLDVSMPFVDGLEVSRRMRAGGDRTPVLMLTALDAVSDRVAGFDAGADDYLVKPFALQELQARLRALLRRSDAGAGAPRLTYADVSMDRRGQQAWRGDRLLALTKTEWLLLELFLKHPGQVLDRAAILERVWGYDFGQTSNTLGVFIGYLRRKLEDGEAPRLVHTVRGIGYVLRD